jgi:release factor glutamine methyltransferase
MMIKFKDYQAIFISELATIYDHQECESIFYIILENKHLLKRIDLALQPNLSLSNEELAHWNFILQELKTEKPIQYILGKTFFYDLEIFVDKNVLIPRQETEELVDWIIKENKNHKIDTLKILDIGTGSGCIAISLAKNIPNCAVTAIDISEKALAIAQKNTAHNQVNINFELNNILQTNDLNQIYDIIVSNPPYVRELEKTEMKKNVLENEPQLALFVADNDPLIFYKKIAELAQKNLSENGKLYFEINQYLGSETFDLLEKMNFKNIKLIQDIYSNDRMLSCIFAKK